MTALPIPFDRGILMISVDFELIWGTLDLPSYRRFLRLCTIERELVEQLLQLLAEFDIGATWCTVGHLFLDRCDHRSRPHPEIIRSSAYDAIRLHRDPGTSEEEDPAFYGRKLVERIRDCPVPQEIGSHGFSHVLFGDPLCSRATAESDLAATVSAARELGIELRSFAFPRNRIGHTDLLRKYGFACYRLQETTWHENVANRRWYHRAAHLAEISMAASPPVVLPVWDPNGLWAVPGSMLYTPSFGVRKLIPVSLRVRRARKGLLAAARQNRIFHLWLHPTDLVERHDAMLDGLRRIFETAADLRAKGELEVLSMGDLTKRLHAAKHCETDSGFEPEFACATVSAGGAYTHNNGTGARAGTPSAARRPARARDYLVTEHFRETSVYWKSVYAERTLNGAMYRERRRAVLGFVDELRLPAAGRVLEVGSGAGSTSVALAERGFQVDAVDAVAEMVRLTEEAAKAKGLSHRIRAIVGDVHHLDFPDSSFDLALAVGVLEWMPSLAEPLRELHRVLQPGGYLVTNVDNAWAFHCLLDPRMNPALAGAKKLARRLAESARLVEPLARPSRISRAGFDRMVRKVGFMKSASRTTGFGPITMLGMRLLPDRVAAALHHKLQHMANLGFPLLQHGGETYLVLARKKGPSRDAETTVC